MNPKKLIIYEYNILFNILNEISEVLNFDIILADKNNFNDLKKNITTDFLIILKSN